MPKKIVKKKLFWEHEAKLGVFGMENPQESCSIGDDGVIIDTPKINGKKIDKKFAKDRMKIIIGNQSCYCI